LARCFPEVIHPGHTNKNSLVQTNQLNVISIILIIGIYNHLTVNQAGMLHGNRWYNHLCCKNIINTKDVILRKGES